MKKYKNQSIVSGLSINDIINMDMAQILKANLSDLRKIVGRLVSAGNKRLRAFEKAGESSPAYEYIMKTGVFSTKGKNLNELRREYMRAKGFLQSETGNLKAWRKLKSETISGLRGQGVRVNEDSYDKLWRAYEQLRKLSPEVANKELKYKILSETSRVLETNVNMSVDEVVLNMNSKITQIYEEQEVIDNEFARNSRFFKYKGDL